ncbi:nose resistant to fluoxetine protein 6-like [Anabrus simplex]|uniref:nose resistant to fluoxetine protein 6-like n=1 Tax=Anabrus simplex TaxID=316456 RepID=UPI0035A2888D
MSTNQTFYTVCVSDTSLIHGNVGKNDLQCHHDELQGTRFISDLVQDVHHFLPISRTVKNELCRSHSNIILRQAKELHTWALKILDSSAKVPSGLLSGNVNQFGDFDQCLSVSKTLIDSAYNLGTSTIKGKYCLTSMKVQVKHHQEINLLINSHFSITSSFTDAGHRIAKLDEIRWGVCMPESCSTDDLERQMINSLSPYNGSGLQIAVKVPPNMCYVQEQTLLSGASKLTITIFVSIFALTLVATWVDRNDGANSGKPLKMLSAFSLRKNIRTLLSTNSSSDDIKSIHGVRALNAVALLIFHKKVASMFNPYINRTSTTEFFALPWSVIGRTSVIYTDTFLLISGLLTSYIFIKELERKGKLDIKDKIISRIIRIVPNMLAVVLFYTFIMVHLGSGPQWNLVVKHHSDVCLRHMWKNFLFIHNLFGFENVCLTHTHHVGIDMQLFLVSPFIVTLLWRNSRSFMAVLAALGLASTLLRFLVTYHWELTTVIYSGIPLSQLFRSFNLTYTLAPHRATVYLMGMAMGYYLKRVQRSHISITKLQMLTGWSAAILCGMVAMFGPYKMVLMEYRYSPMHAAVYNAFSPVLWGIFISWVIFTANIGRAGFLGDIVCWRGFVIFTRLAYALYLTQYPVFLYNVGVTRHAGYYTTSMLFSLGEIFCIVVSAIVLTLLVDLPAQRLRKILWNENGEVYKAPVHTLSSQVPANMLSEMSPSARRRRRG